jgi:UDP-N-acetylmuramate: L-alanyl-gamma-D-glutamyl-meso-diaminopimelate ligase
MPRLTSNPIPANVRHIHLIAVCGTAMGALACMLKELDYQVTGSDQNIYPPMSDFLEARAIRVFNGYKADHIKPAPDLVIVGNAVSKDNPEVVAMQQAGLAYCSMPEAINAFAAAGKKQIVVTGTHGKTTTSSFIAWMLHSAGLDPSFLIGGIVSNFNRSFGVGQGSWIVLEGDEYDTAYFDKGPKFWHYTPEAAVLTGIEFDHADIFKDIGHVKRVFAGMLSRLEPSTGLVAYDQDDNVRQLLHHAGCQVLPYGRNQDSAWHLERVRMDAPFTCFEVWRKGHRWAEFKTRMIGDHNLCNLLAGIAVGHRLQIDLKRLQQATETFLGVRRRQEVRGVVDQIVVIDDFAHHPTAVKATIEAVKRFYGSRRLIAVFEPRTNSSRRNIFQTHYAASFEAADLVCIRQPPMLDKIPERERFSSEQLVDDLTKRGGSARYFPDTDAIIECLLRDTRPQDVVLIMSNGGFDNIHVRLLAGLKSRSAHGPGSGK